MSARDAIDPPVHIRPASAAGRFYPSDPDALRRDLRRYLEPPEAGEVGPDKPKPLRAVIAPHAGYIYSAPVAASAYRRVESLKDKVHRVVLIGPAHYVPFSGLAGSSASAFQTPLGAVPVDVESTRALAGAGKIIIHDAAHAPEHGLEVHLPFLIHTLCPSPEPDCMRCSLLPLIFGDIAHDAVAGVLDPFLDDPATLIVVSSDLSHYHDYNTASRVDRETADAIVAGRLDLITTDRACGHTAIRALLACVERRGLTVTELDLRNSGDTAGPRDRVVGYGSFVVQ